MPHGNELSINNYLQKIMQIVNLRMHYLISQQFLLFHNKPTEVKEHADKDDEAEPGVKIRNKVNNGNDDVCYSWQHGEHNIAMKTERIHN